MASKSNNPITRLEENIMGTEAENKAAEKELKTNRMEQKYQRGLDILRNAMGSAPSQPAPQQPQPTPAPTPAPQQPAPAAPGMKAGGKVAGKLATRGYGCAAKGKK